jgi:hypothetical protein
MLHGLLDGSRVVSVGKCDHDEDKENVYHCPGHEVSIGLLINAQRNLKLAIRQYALAYAHA